MSEDINVKAEAEAEESKTFNADYVKELREEAKQHRIAKQELESQLNEIKTKLEADKKAELEKKQEFEQLYKQTQAKLDEVLPKYETTSKELNEIKEATKKELLSRFSEEEQSIYSDLAIAKLRELAKIKAEAKPSVDTSRQRITKHGEEKKPDNFAQWKKIYNA